MWRYPCPARLIYHYLVISYSEDQTCSSIFYNDSEGFICFIRHSSSIDVTERNWHMSDVDLSATSDLVLFSRAESSHALWPNCRGMTRRSALPHLDLLSTSYIPLPIIKTSSFFPSSALYRWTAKPSRYHSTRRLQNSRRRLSQIKPMESEI